MLKTAPKKPGQRHEAVAEQARPAQGEVSRALADQRGTGESAAEGQPLDPAQPLVKEQRADQHHEDGGQVGKDARIGGSRVAQ